MSQYSKRRDYLLSQMNDNSACLLFSGKAIMKSEDEAYDFDVNRNFYYLTGLQKEDMVLLLSKINGVTSTMLFILPFDETMARWVGGRMSKKDASLISQIENVKDYEELEDAITRILNRQRALDNFVFYFDFWHYTMSQDLAPGAKYAKDLRDKYPNLNTKDIYPILTAMRLVKDEEEIANIKKAIAITNDGISKMQKVIKPDMSEMIMEGVFDFELKVNGCKHTAFGTICASGQRATILHYSDNNQIMKDGELFLCDLGATYSKYCADITRTFPVNGKFSERQKEIYNMVLTAQQIVIDNAKPGVSVKDLNGMVVDYYKEELPKHGLVEDVFEYYFHSVSHHLGLDTHDVDSGLGLILEKGNVITNEPGLYIASEGIGIRIEDDLLITDEGCEVLSKDIIKSVEDIENFMAK